MNCSCLLSVTIVLHLRCPQAPETTVPCKVDIVVQRQPETTVPWIVDIVIGRFSSEIQTLIPILIHRSKWCKIH